MSTLSSVILIATLFSAFASSAFSQEIAQGDSLAEERQRKAEEERSYRLQREAEEERGIRKEAFGSERATFTKPTVESLNDMAAFYYSQGKYAKAEAFFKWSLAIQEKALGPDHPDMAESLHSLAGLYHYQGKYAEAEPLYRRVLGIREKALGPEHPDVAYSLNNLAALYSALGKYAEAEPLFNQALAVREKALSPDHPDVARSLNNLALVYYFQGKYAEAEPLYRRSLTIQEKVLSPDHSDMAISLNNLAALFRVQGKYAEAEPLFKQALAIRKKALNPNHPDVAGSLNGLAYLYYFQGKYAEAEPLFKQALTIRKKALGSNHPDVAGSLNNLAVLETALHRPKAALSLMKRALLIDDHLIENVFSVASEREKFAFLRIVADKFDILQSLVVQELPADPEAVRVALNATLRRKGLVLDALSRERTALLVSDNSYIIDTSQQLQVTASRLASLTFAGPGELTSDVYKSRLKELEMEKERLEKELAQLSDVYAAKRKSRLMDPDQIVRALEPGSVLLEFVGFQMANFHATGAEKQLGAYRYVVYVLPAGQQAKPVLVNLGEADSIDRAIRDFRQEVEQAPQLIPQLGEAEVERRLREKGKRVYDLVIAPLRKVIGPRDILYLSPDGELNLIPFEVLPDESGRYLVETCQINYLSSGRDLMRFEAGKGAGSETMVLADPDYDLKHADRKITAQSSQDSLTLTMRGTPQRSGDLRQAIWSSLPGTRKEAEAIAKELTGQKVQLYLKDQASEERIKQVKAPRILHLATHGFFLNEQDKSAWLKDTERGLTFSSPDQRPAPLPSNIENPLLRSGLALAGANRLGEVTGEGEDDGILTALEISGIRLWGTDLVVLSACETGVGEARRGEGVFGLRRAFQLAGARTVVMSLWSVPDEETAALMRDFYRRLKGGAGKSQALREASLGLMRARRERVGAAHPFYWGAFVSVGEP